MPRKAQFVTLLMIGLAAGVLSLLGMRGAANPPSQTPPPAIELRAVSSACYEFIVRDSRVPADGWRVNFRFGGSTCLTLSSFSPADGEVVGIVCCAGTVPVCQDQLQVTGSDGGRTLFTVSREINCP